jgi:hypothetical protein
MPTRELPAEVLVQICELGGEEATRAQNEDRRLLEKNSCSDPCNRIRFKKTVRAAYSSIMSLSDLCDRTKCLELEM